MWAEVRGETWLDVVGDGSTRWLPLEVPEVIPRVMDAGGEVFVTEWRIESVSANGRPLPVRVAEIDPETRLATRRDRRLVWVELEDLAAATVSVTWSQRVPFGRSEWVATRIAHLGDATPPLPAMPRVAGAATTFPYRLTVAAPEGPELSVSGITEAERHFDGIVESRSRGRAGGEAVVALGKWSRDQSGTVRALFKGRTRGHAATVLSLGDPLVRWSGRSLPEELEVVELAAAWRPSAAVFAEGWVGLRPKMRIPGQPLERLPGLEDVLLSEGVAGAAWPAGSASSEETRAWSFGMARAFALDVLATTDPDGARKWRKTLQKCLGPAHGVRPALSPNHAATHGFSDISARCAAPLILGTALHDRLGSEGARTARAIALEAGPLTTESLRVAILAVDPSAGPWVTRWIEEGHPTHIDLDWDAVATEEGAVVRGELRPDLPLAGAPVVLRFARGLRSMDVVVSTEEVGSTAWEVTLPFSPLTVRIDPERRLLRVQ